MNKIKNIVNFVALTGLGVAGLFALIQNSYYNDTKRYLEKEPSKIAYAYAVKLITEPEYKWEFGMRTAAIKYMQTHSQPDSSDTTTQKPKAF